MAWPLNAANIVTTNMDSQTDSPAAARADIKAALDELSNVILARGEANGVVPLNASLKISNTYLPNTIISSSGIDILLVPNTGRVNINDVVNLTPLTLAQVGSLFLTPEQGDIAYCTNGDAGAKCLVVWDGTNWRVVQFGAVAATS